MNNSRAPNLGQADQVASPSLVAALVDQYAALKSFMYNVMDLQYTHASDIRELGTTSLAYPG